MIGATCSLEDACQQAQDMINQVSRCWKNALGPDSLALISNKSLPSQKKEQNHSRHSIQSKLTRLYFEELSKVPHATPDSVLNNLENECDLLGRLVQREGLHTLIVNLYAGNKGYSLAVRNSDKGNQYDKNSLLAETQLMGYEQGELLSCIDNGQLPAMLAEQLESNYSHLFYDGCIIAEVRDYRKSYSHNRAEVHHVLLKPTTQSVLSDVSTLTNDGDWSHEERLMLESHLVAATQGPLCLDPNPIPTLASTRIKQSKSLLTDHQLMRQAKKFSQVTVNRKRKLEQLAQPEGQTIQDLMQKFRAKRRGLATNTACPPPFLTSPPLLPPSSAIEVLRYAKAYERPQETIDCTPQVIEEYILEPAESQDYIKLSILQRPATSEYLGELYMDKNHCDGKKNGSSCRFTLGTRAVANHYYQQFKEIFTEEGRKNVRIKHIISGQTRIACTPGMQRAHQQAQHAKLTARQLQQIQSQQIAQQQIRMPFQILSRAQGQLNTLTGQVASMKAMTEATTSVQNSLSCVDSANMPQVIPQNDATVLSSGQSLANGGSNASTSVQVDNPAMAVADNTCNGSGILVFQQKSSGTINNATSTNVPVLQAQLQAGTQNCIGETANQNQNEPPFKKHSTNPAISALVTSLMNSAHQFQQQAAANAAAAAMNNNAQASSKSSNAAILSLLNSTPANLAQQKVQPRKISLNASIPSRVFSHGNVINVPSTTGQVRVSLNSALTGQLGCKQQPLKTTTVRLARVQDPTSTLGLSMPGLSAMLAGTPSADNPIPGMNSASSLLERLTASSSQSSQPASPMTSPSPTNVNLQGVNLTSLPNSINGLQNVQVSFSGLPQPITMSFTMSPSSAGTVTPVIVSLPISSATNTCTTVSSMVATTVVTTAIAGSTPTVVIANPANPAHLSLPIAQIIPSVKGLSQQNIRSNNAVTLAQGGQAIQLIGSQRPRFNHMTRQVQSNQVKSAVLSNQLVTVAKTANQLILSGNKQVLTPIMTATKPVLMASQTTPSSQVVPVNKQTLLTKSLHARTSTGQCSQQTQSLGVTTLSQQQFQQLQQCLAAQHKVAVAAGSSQSRTQIEAQRNSTSAPGEDPA